MAWLPFERYELTSPLTAGQIKQKLADTTGNTENYSVKQVDNTILIKTAERFRLGGYHQSFKPRAAIQIKVTAGGSRLSVVLKPNITAIGVLALTVAIFMAGIWFSQRTNLAIGRYKDAVVAGAGLLILAYLLPVTAFNGELPQLKQFINEVFEVQEEN